MTALCIHPLSTRDRITLAADCLSDAAGHAAAIARNARRGSDTRRAAEALQLALDAALERARRLGIDYDCERAVAALGDEPSDAAIHAALLAHDPDFAAREQMAAENRAAYAAKQGVVR